jgi:hypothetical protein
MTDETELQAEIDRLREHSDKLLAEKKKAVAELVKLQESNDTLTAQIEQRDAAPINDVFESLAGENFAGYLRDQFDRDFQVSKNDDGKLEVRDHDGKPIELEGEPCAFTAGNIRKLATERQMKNLDSLILAPVNSGGGSNTANGAGRAAHTKSREPEAENSHFGLR